MIDATSRTVQTDVYDSSVGSDGLHSDSVQRDGDGDLPSGSPIVNQSPERM